MADNGLWRAECRICCYAAATPTDWQAEDRADTHTADRPGHTVDVFQERTTGG